MPNTLSDVLPGKVARPGKTVNCTRETRASLVSMEGAGWQRAWPAVRRLPFSKRERDWVSNLRGQRLHLGVAMGLLLASGM